MRGINVASFSGNVGSRIDYGKTESGSDAVAFDLAVENAPGETVWIRVNAYDDLVEVCRPRLERGRYCHVVGKIVKRKRRLELRAREIVFSGEVKNQN